MWRLTEAESVFGWSLLRTAESYSSRGRDSLVLLRKDGAEGPGVDLHRALVQLWSGPLEVLPQRGRAGTLVSLSAFP